MRLAEPDIISSCVLQHANRTRCASFTIRRFPSPTSQSGLFLDCRIGGRAAWTMLAVECGAASMALDVHLEDG